MLGKKLLTWGAKVGAALVGAWLGTMIGGGNLGGGIGLLIGLAAAEVIIWLRREPEDETNTIIPEDAIPQPKPDQHVKRGMDYLGRADFQRALVEFREAQRILGDLRDDRSRLRALIGLALSEWAAGNIPGAEAALEAASRFSSSESKLAALIESCKKEIKQTANTEPLLVAPLGFESREGIGFGDLVPVEVRVLTELFLKLPL